MSIADAITTNSDVIGGEKKQQSRVDEEQVKRAVGSILGEAVRKSRLLQFLADQWNKLVRGIHKHNLQTVVRGFIQFVVAVCLILVGNVIIAITSGVFGAMLALLVTIVGLVVLFQLAFQLASAITRWLLGRSIF